MSRKINNLRLRSLTKYGFEFLSIFIAVISAFALNNWNENRRNNFSENKILIEIANGLEKDLDDVRENKLGYTIGIEACNYFKYMLTDKKIETDSSMIFYSRLTRDFVSVQNIAGYETLKSKGLELIKNDELRLEIINLYEYNYNTLQKLEEEYDELQFQENYFKEINKALVPNFKFDDFNNFIGIRQPIKINENSKKELLMDIWKIQKNREFIVGFYNEIEVNIKQVKADIGREIKR